MNLEYEDCLRLIKDQERKIELLSKQENKKIIDLVFSLIEASKSYDGIGFLMAVRKLQYEGQLLLESSHLHPISHPSKNDQ